MAMAEFKAHSDHGTVLQRDQAALVAEADGSFSLLMPDLPEEALPSEAVQLLVAVAMRTDDPLWVEEMIAFLHEQKTLG
ncbi:MAG: hypothetical protein APF80_15870 [Alphaproteobacteria bacterium BRH_c36]|nr:MAG: hypothetical protein APF80_15870 [Alphaproteobacteria bacterium BRH_c36]